MRRKLGLVCLLFLMCPPVAGGQSFQLQGSAGPTIIDAGHSLAAGVGFILDPQLSILIDWERTHMTSRVRRDERGRVTSASRGGTLTLAAAELRVALLRRERVGPYGLAGFAAGVSRPNVNDIFPDPVTNDVQAIMFGGGANAPFGERMSIFADARLLFGIEGDDGIVGALPIRAGVAWRF